MATRRCKPMHNSNRFSDLVSLVSFSESIYRGPLLLLARGLIVILVAVPWPFRKVLAFTIRML